MMKQNYQKELEKIIAAVPESGQVPSLLLHSCCAPCSSYVLEYLTNLFAVTVFYYNPNIYPDIEYQKRVQEQKEFIRALPVLNKVEFIEGDFDPKVFYDCVNGYETQPEGGERCFLCYRLRMEAAARLASQLKMDYFCTTLSISPLKNSGKINEIGASLADQYGVLWLPSDFKKKEGYKRSTELSKKYDLYRQDYCGCIFSQNRE